MNNIYKVIWSKAKNCYVVASEIARSHTKSATGSEKIGGVTRRSLLASLMALSLLCGGFGVASAVDGTVDVEDIEATTTSKQVYTADKVDNLLKEYGKKTDVEDNKNNIATLRTTTTDQGKQITENATNIANNTAAIDKKIDREIAETKLALKANTTDVYSKTDADGKFATNDALNDLKDTVNGKADRTYVDQKFTEAGTNVDNKLEDYYNKAEVDGKIKAEENARNTAINTAVGLEKEDRNAAIGNAINGEVTARNQEIHNAIEQEKTNRDAAVNNAKTELQSKITKEETARKEADTDFNTRLTTAEGKIGANETAIGDLKAADTALEGKITKNREDIATLNGKVATAEGNITDLKKKDTELDGRIKTNEGNIETNKNAISDINKRTAGIQRIDATKETTIEGNVTVNSLGNVTAEGDVTAKGKLTGDGVDAGAGAITTKGAVNAGSLNVTDASNLKGDVTMDKTLQVTGDTSLNNTDVGGKLNVTGASDLKGNVILGTDTANTVTVNGKADFKVAVNMDKGLTVTNGDTKLKATTVEGKLTAGDADLKNTTVDGTLSVNKETTLGDKLTAKGEATFEKNVTAEKDLTVNGTLKTKDVTAETINISKSENNPDYKSEGSIIGEGGKLSVSNEKFDKRNNITEKSELNVNEKGTVNWATSTDNATGNVTEGRSEVTADKIKNSVKKTEGGTTFGYEENITETGKVGTATDKDGNRNELTQTATGTENTVTSKDGNKSTTKQEAGSISSTVYDKDGKVKASSEMKEDGSISNNATGDMTNTVGGKLTTTVAGQATEEFNGGLNTTVTGTENHTVNGKQINTIKNGQENIISGGQTNTITGGQINNITGDQTTTITGNKTETVTENVTEDYQKDLTTTVGGNENHEVKGTKTETVEGKVTENYKAGQVTNVTGDQDITVSGTQTTTATDINRNASSGMIDTIDNDYGTNTETKVAGKTTTDVSIKGTGEEGKYIRGANESRDYLIKGTLKNSETKTVEATSTEITDGNGKTSATIQDVNNLAGSVTNGTETGVSGIHANDNSVSIDSIVTDGNKYSVINQKKGSIQSTVVDGTNSTVILQDKDNVTIASSNGMVGLVGKDIVNNAQNTITNTAGTSITNQVKDSKVTTDANGTTFENNTPAVSDGGATTTKINGNQITTGRVDANELGVSDKDGDNTADFSVKAGKGVKASAGNGNTTGSLDVKADGIYGSATDKDGNKTSTKVTATENSFQVQDKDGNIKNHQVNTKDKSENTIKNGDKTNIVTSTADGTTFNNSKANTAFEGGTYTDTTIKGNTITTGKVTMDYAEVMRDLGVNGNANITGKTTTGSLEVKGESKLTGDVTMESNATVGKNLTVNGITTTKTLNVTEDAKVGRDLAVDGNATIKGDVTARSYQVEGKTYIDKNGIHANGQKITDVADGSISEGSKDAVNGGQLYTVKNDLEGKVNKVGANAAAMANLHPMEFDPSSKWNIAAAIGNYGSETAAALGAFYRPNDDVMVNLSTAFGTGENMVGGGVSVRLGKGGNKLSREESNALKDQVNDLTARMDALLSVLNPNMSKDFPDVPENHWAYEAVSRLAGNDIVQGYPDGEFHGERTMTRYEMAEIIYNALSRGAEAEKELVEEFKPELQAMAASEKATAERAEG